MPPSPLNLPPALPENATLGIVAPASPPAPERFERGVAALRESGFRVVLGEHVHDRHGHLAGWDEDRAADLNAMFARDDVDAVVCARGGSGAIRLLDRIDYAAIAARPKLFIGYSDITVLQLALLRRCRLPSIFGPMVQPDFAGGLERGCANALWLLACSREPAGSILGARREPALRVLAGGRAEGPLVGGTLSLLVACLGTPYQPDLDGAILFFEDIYENPAHIERYLIQLRWAGILDAAAGFLIGPTVWDAEPAERERFLTFEQVYEDLLVPLNKPVLAGAPVGHLRDPMSLPQGVRVALDADRGDLEVLEAMVR